MRLLIIDDEENIRRTTSVALEAMGHEVVSVGQGATGLKQLERAHVDVAFLDLKLAGENGLELLPELLAADPRLAVVVFTAHASIETAVEAMRRGATDYIAKPFTPEQIRQILSKISKTRQLEGHSFWTRSAKCRWKSNLSSCACFRKKSMREWEKPKRAAPTCGSSPPRTGISNKRSTMVVSGKISSTV